MLSATTAAEPGLDQSCEYDATGNMTFNSRMGYLSYPQSGSPRPHAPETVNGQPMSHDANGNLLSGRGRTITWRADDLPEHVNGTSFTYDGNGCETEEGDRCQRVGAWPAWRRAAGTIRRASRCAASRRCRAPWR